MSGTNAVYRLWTRMTLFAGFSKLLKKLDLDPIKLLQWFFTFKGANVRKILVNWLIIQMAKKTMEINLDDIDRYKNIICKYRALEAFRQKGFIDQIPIKQEDEENVVAPPMEKKRKCSEDDN